MPRSPLTIAALALVTAVVLSGCASGGLTPVGTDGPLRPVDGEILTPTEPETAIGTQENPVPVGSTAKFDEQSVWNYQIGFTDTDGRRQISAFGEFATPPAAGSSHLLALVNVTVDDVAAVAEGADPGVSFAFEYVTASGSSYDRDSCGVLELPLPGDLLDVGTMFGGASAVFLACAQVPTDEVAGGTWKVTSLVDPSSFTFFAGAPV